MILELYLKTALKLEMAMMMMMMIMMMTSRRSV